MEQTTIKHGTPSLVRKFYEVASATGSIATEVTKSVSSKLSSVYDTATGHKKLMKMGRRKSSSYDETGRGITTVIGGVLGIVGVAISAPITIVAVVGGAPLALLLIAPLLLEGLLFAPLQVHTLYEMGKAASKEAKAEAKAAEARATEAAAEQSPEPQEEQQATTASPTNVPQLLDHSPRPRL